MCLNKYLQRCSCNIVFHTNLYFVYLQLLRPEDADCPKISEIRHKMLASKEYKEKSEENKVIIFIFFK